MLEFKDFPKVQDILSIIKIESRFNPNARNGVSNGLMQVNHGSLDIGTNMSQGVKLLREYYVMLGSERAAVLAYNSGPSSYRRGRFKIKYFEKFKENRYAFERWLIRRCNNDSRTGDGNPRSDDDRPVRGSSYGIFLSANRTTCEY